MTHLSESQRRRSAWRWLGQALTAPFWLTFVFVFGYVRVYLRIARTFRFRALANLFGYAWRVLKFGTVGGGIAVLGYALLLYVLPRTGVPENVSLVVGPVSVPLKIWVLVTAAVTVELNFLGSRYVTWRDRRAIGLARSWWRFHVLRVWTLFFNDIVYQPLLLNAFHQPYWLANTAGLVVGSAVNYIASDLYVFAAGDKRRAEDHSTIVIAGRKQPKVTIILPCRNNDRQELSGSIEALMRQGYFLSQRRSVQIYVVGSVNDTSWLALRGISPLAPINVVEVPVDSPGRDTNAKREVGLRHSNGDIVVYMDPDVMPNKDWLANIVYLLTEGGEVAVGGPVSGIGDSFWDRFIDRTESGAKTPRVPRVIHIDKHNSSQHKFPVTANFAARRTVLEEVGGFDPRYWKSLEDFSLMQALVDAGYVIRLDPTLNAERHHRTGLGPLSREYQRSAGGFRHFAALNPGAAFTHLRLAQFAAMPLGLGLAIAGLYLFPVQTAVLLSAAVISLVQRNVLAARRLSGVIYPLIGIWLSLRYVYGFCQDVAIHGFRRPRRPRIGQPQTKYVVEPPSPRRR